ncbi:hypothetical protein V1L54_25045 [Streptomyces sp. TRM 70361]|uniref:hypothetical protein n=1 Tax=Streptomyces sp. TRM 70361 TaxID=3116553 RepID=UPI002E7BE376|nr:hypothetical protein [Streptomyces sp. TRM 70361]MEE1942632.1 hypothetical protein [Streptomyces sp. TRM 70361]
MRHAPGIPHRRRSAALLALLLALPGLAGCGGNGAEGITEVHEAFEDGNAESVVGEERTVEGRVHDVVSPWAFTVGGNEPSDIEPLLVVEGDMPAVDQDDPVRVTGVVREFEIAGVEEELGVELSDTLYEQYEGEPYIRARSIAEDVELD